MNAVTFEELLNAPVTDLPSKTQVDAWYDGTKYMHEFSREVMLPLLKMLLGPSHQEIAVRDTYYRMSLLLRSILVMNSLDHFQSVASLTRSLFELWLDLSILAQDTTGDAVRRYNEFPEVERYRVAEQLIRFAATNAQSLKMDITAQRTFHADAHRTRRIAQIVKTDSKGKRKYPDHWTSKSVRQRAIEVGQEVMYVETYPQLSWYVHAGACRHGWHHQRRLRACFWILPQPDPANVRRCNIKMCKSYKNIRLRLFRRLDAEHPVEDGGDNRCRTNQNAGGEATARS